MARLYFEKIAIFALKNSHLKISLISAKILLQNIFVLQKEKKNNFKKSEGTNFFILRKFKNLPNCKKNYIKPIKKYKNALK